VRSASRGLDLRRTGARKAGEQFEKEVRVFVARGKVNFNLRHPHPLLYTGRGASGNPQSNSAASINGHIKNPAEPLRARAASPPSSDAFGTR
jgi:hypothetical protein